MLFHWQSRHRGACVVNSACAAHGVCVIIAWGTEHDGDSVEYRIENVTGQESAACLERATRYAMGHFDWSNEPCSGLLNLAIDGQSRYFDGPLPAALA